MDSCLVSHPASIDPPVLRGKRMDFEDPFCRQLVATWELSDPLPSPPIGILLKAIPQFVID